jgi:hypothetical protein
MDFQEYCKAIASTQSAKWTDRQKRLDAYARILKRKQYSHLKTPFSHERDGKDGYSGERVLLDNRRAAVQEPLAVELVRDAIGLLFGEDHRPLILAKSETEGVEKDPKTPTTDWIAAFIKDSKFWITMMDATWRGAIGSSVVVLRVLGKQKAVAQEGDAPPQMAPDGPGRFFFEVWPAQECSPKFFRSAPDELESVERVYFLGEDSLAAQGYDVDALKTEWSKKRGAAKNEGSILGRAPSSQSWVLRVVLDTKAETWYNPVPRHVFERPSFKAANWTVDSDRTVTHELDETPAMWIRPLPIDADDLFPDGTCLFDPVIDYQFRIDRTLSQTGRALDYAGDPQLARILSDGPEGAAGEFGEPLAVGGTASDVLDSPAGGDVKFVEISGDGLKVAIESYVDALRKIAREAGAMSRVTPESKSGASGPLSSAAMKMLNFAQLTLCGILRQTCGEEAGTRLIRLAMRMSEKVTVKLPSLTTDAPPDVDANLDWQWPEYYELHGQEKMFEVQATALAKQGELISQETAVANTAPMFDVQNAHRENSDIENDRDEALAFEVTKAGAIADVTQKSQENVAVN